MIVGTKGSANLDGMIYDLSGKQIWRYDGPVIDRWCRSTSIWVTAIRKEKPINTAKETALATLMAIMGRDSAYTGKAITWDELMASTARLGPTEYSLGAVALKAEPPVPGVDQGGPLTTL